MADDVDGRVVVVGGGVMGAALLASVVAAVRDDGPPGERVVLVEPDEARAQALAAEHGVALAPDLESAAPDADVVLIAVKPAVVSAVLAGLWPHVGPGTLVVSVAAGVPLETYQRELPHGTPVVRVMPNTPAAIGQGVAAIAGGAWAGPEHLTEVRRLLAATGLVVEVAEHDLDAVTAISGSGPAYVFYLIDAMAEAGVLLGLGRQLAQRLAVATVAGSAALAAASGEHPAVLRERVSSPGGTTVTAVAELDAHAVRAGVVAAARAARDRAAQLGAQAGHPLTGVA